MNVARDKSQYCINQRIRFMFVIMKSAEQKMNEIALVVLERGNEKIHKIH